MAIKLSRIGHAALRVRDPDKAKKFYTEVLGFDIVEEDPEHGGCFMRLSSDQNSDGHSLDLVGVEDPETALAPPGSNGVGVVHIAIKVDSFEDMRDAYDHLKDHGVEVNRLIEHANQRSMYFTDPDGNGLEIYYEYPTSRELFDRGRGDRDFVFSFDDPIPPWATKVPDDWDPETTADRYHRGTDSRMRS